MSADYCSKCGCPKEICCGQNKVSLEWLERFCNEEKDDIIYELANVRVQQLLEAAKKEAGKK